MSFGYTIISGDVLLYLTKKDGNLEQAQRLCSTYELLAISYFLVVDNLKIDPTFFKPEHDSKLICLILGGKKRTKNIFLLLLFQKTYKKRTL